MGNIVIFGGELANGSLASDVWMYRPNQDDWQQLGFSHSRGAPKLANHAAAVVDSYLCVFGGGLCIILSVLELLKKLLNGTLLRSSFLVLIFHRSYRGGHVFLFFISFRPPWFWTVGDYSAHWRKAPGHCWPLHGIPQPIQDTPCVWRPQAYHCQVHTFS